MLGMMNNKGGQNTVDGQQPPIANLAAMFGSNRPMGPQPGAAPQPGQNVQVPWISQPVRPVLAPPPRIPMPQPVAPARSPVMSARDFLLRHHMMSQNQRRRGEK